MQERASSGLSVYKVPWFMGCVQKVPFVFQAGETKGDQALVSSTLTMHLVQERLSPENKPSFVHTASNCSLKLQMPLSQLMDTTEILTQMTEFSIVLEFLVRRLPPQEQYASIMTVASLYC